MERRKKRKNVNEDNLKTLKKFGSEKYHPFLTAPHEVGLDITSYYVQLNDALCSELFSHGNYANLFKITTIQESIITKVITLYASRYQEIRNLLFSDHLSNGMYIVRGLKRSRDYSILLPGFEPQKEIPVGLIDTEIFYDVTYKRLYQLWREFGIRRKIDGKKNWKVLHAPRYATAEIVNEKEDKTSASDILRHNSKKTIDYYIKK
jgi:hypothetical protein